MLIFAMPENSRSLDNETIKYLELVPLSFSNYFLYSDFTSGKLTPNSINEIESIAGHLRDVFDGIRVHVPPNLQPLLVDTSITMIEIAREHYLNKLES